MPKKHKPSSCNSNKTRSTLQKKGPAFAARISSTFCTVIRIPPHSRRASSDQIKTDLMSHSQFPRIKIPFELRLAWLNLRDKHMTTGRINQVSSLRVAAFSRDPSPKNTSSSSSKYSTADSPTQPTPYLAWPYKSVATLPCTYQSYVILSFASPTPQSRTPPHVTVQSHSRLWLVEPKGTPLVRGHVRSLYQTASSPPISQDRVSSISTPSFSTQTTPTGVARVSRLPPPGWDGGGRVEKKFCKFCPSPEHVPQPWA